MNWLDQAITWVAPQTGLRRIQARTATQALLAYEGAKIGRRTGGWTANGSSANSEINSGLITLRARARDLVRNNPYAARAIDELTTQTIGTGIQAQTATEDERLNESIDRAWTQWTEECDADGQLDFNGIQDLVTRQILEAGESLIRFRVRFADDGFRIPLQLQVVEPDLLDHGKTEKTPGGYIIQGVEFDQLGRRIAYWMFAEHPGEVISTSRTGNLASRRIPADQIMHVYRKKRAHQARGVPVFAPVMLAMRDLDEYQDAERVRKKIEACLALFISPPEGSDGTPYGVTSTEDGTGNRLEEFRPGMIAYGRPGEKAEFFAPTGAGGYGEYVKQNERAIATGTGLTYEQLTGDLSNVNYSSYRAGLVSFQSGIESFRWLTITPMFLRPVRRRFIDNAFAAGEIRKRVYDTQWTPPAFGSIDELKDAEAAQINMRTGRRTWPDVVSELGYDPRKKIKEINKWKPALDAAGVTFNPKAVNNDPNETAQPAAQ